MIPALHTTSIGMEYYCNEKDELWNMADAALKDLATRELAELGLAAADNVIDAVVLRQPQAYPVYDVGYHDNINILREFLGGFNNLQTIGRNGMHRYNNMDHSILTGILAAQNLFGSRHDLWQVNEEDKFLEEN